MKRIHALFLAYILSHVILILGCRSNGSKSMATAPPPEAKSDLHFLSDIGQLTFGGQRSGESYFSKDGKEIIFQSEREAGNPFYQMYVMNLESGRTHRVSPGNGKTTCGWIHPNGSLVLFSSTHEDPDWQKKAKAEYEERKNPKQHYSWNFDETYDIYQADIKGGHLKNLTKTRGYDAEGSYSPDGKWIAFASNRAGYAKGLSPADAKAFAKDPSYMMDLYIMQADGSHVRRLTTAPGYDGGPFFSPDGKRLVFRHFSTDGRTAEIYSMNVDGSDLKPLTHMGVMSWAPFYSPSGDYIIFASNKLGYGNFELFIVDTQGKHEPVRVTDKAGFDGLPVFSPDGSELLWTHSDPGAEAQVYRAKWNDALARQQLSLSARAPTPNNLQTQIRASDAKTWVEYLASPKFEGRLTGNPLEIEYAKTLAENFQAMGLKSPTSSDTKDFIQTYEFNSGIGLGTNNDLKIRLHGKALDLTVEKDWIPLSYSKTGAFPESSMVFAGYGLKVSANTTQPEYDSYKNLDLKGKWAVVFSGLPENIPNERRFFLNMGSRLQNKALSAHQAGAIGLLVVDDQETQGQPLRLNFEGRSDSLSIPVIQVSALQADMLFKNNETSRQVWTEKLASGQTQGFAFQDALITAQVDLHFEKSKAHNVLGLLKIPGAKTTVIVGAHLDHLGHGELGNSLAKVKGQIHPGADDNASGVAAVMEVAADLANQVRLGQVHLKQNVLFALWTGEEIGILGSSHFAQANKALNLSASINLDMVGRYRSTLFVQGLGSAPEWKGLVESVNATQRLNVQTQEDPYLPSDALTFYMQQLPSIMLFTGSHPQYHTPQDQPDLLNYEGLADVARFAERLTSRLASSAQSLVHYQKVNSDPKTHPTRGLRLYLGTIPDYARELKHGVAITGTVKDSPAEAAGLAAGDIILSLGGMKVENLYDYVYCLQSLKPNKKTVVWIERKGAKQELSITPKVKTE